MPILDLNKENPTVDGRQSERALQIQQGVSRHFAELGMALLPEFTLSTGRRSDLIGLDRKGQTVIIEIKSSIEDFRVDTKWPEYLKFCDQFYFATLPDVPADIFPESEGLIIADRYGCEVLREAQLRKLPSATRKSLSLRFARSAALRLERVTQYCVTMNGDLPEGIGKLGDE